jgi:hypothetical protein
LVSACTVFSLSKWEELWCGIPSIHRLGRVERIFFTGEDGYHLSTFYQKCDGIKPTLLVVQTAALQVFGAFLTADWFAT